SRNRADRRLSVGLRPRVPPSGLLSRAGMRLIVDLRQILEVQVRIDLRAGDARVPKHFLDRAQIARRLQQVRSERMAQHVRVHVPAETTLYCPVRETPLVRARRNPAPGARREHRVGLADAKSVAHLQANTTR